MDSIADLLTSAEIWASVVLGYLFATVADAVRARAARLGLARILRLGIAINAIVPPVLVLTGASAFFGIIYLDLTFVILSSLYYLGTSVWRVSLFGRGFALAAPNIAAALVAAVAWRNNLPWPQIWTGTLAIYPLIYTTLLPVVLLIYWREAIQRERVAQALEGRGSVAGN